MTANRSTNVSGGREGGRYRFPPLVRAGFFGSMPRSQAIPLTIGAVIALVAVTAGAIVVGAVAVLAALTVAFVKVGALKLHEWLPLRAQFWRRRRNRVWFRTIPLLGTNGDRTPIDLPAALTGLELFDVDAAWVNAPGRLAGLGVIVDRPAGLVTAVVRVAGDGQFSLSDPAEQDSRVGLWGEALSGFCREGSPVARIGWSEWCTTATARTRTPAAAGMPVVLDGSTDPIRRAEVSYQDLIGRAAPPAVTHDILLTVTVDVARARLRRGTGTGLDARFHVLSDEVRMFVGRLESAGLRVDTPLSAVEITTAVRTRSDPATASGVAGHLSSLAHAVGVSAGDLAPMAVNEDWTSCQIDGAIHRAYWVSGWPRRDVPAAWMDLLLLATGGTRTVSVVFEPVPPSRSDLDVQADATALDAAAGTRQKHGFRVRRKDTRKQSEVDEREGELVAGYGELRFAGFVHVTATTAGELDDAAADIEQTAAHVGVLLRAVDGRHGAGWVAGLPVGRTLTGRPR